MKLICLCLMILCAAPQQKGGDPLDHTVALLKQGDLSELYKTLAPSIDLGVLADENTYSEKQAEGILNSFFAKNPVTGATVVHKVNSNAEMQYAVIIIATKNGSFRTSFTLKNNKGTFQLTELSIQPEKSY